MERVSKRNRHRHRLPILFDIDQVQLCIALKIIALHPIVRSQLPHELMRMEREGKLCLTPATRLQIYSDLLKKKCSQTG